jgi:serine phosphatase RsbU (regulator of sigma subunit)
LAEPFPSSPRVKTFYPSEYKANHHSFNVTQTVSGLILVGNVDGLLVYDGERWELHQLPGKKIVRSIASSDRDKIFVGSWGDFGYFEPDSITGLRYVSLSHLVGMSDYEIGDIWQVFIDADTTYYLNFHHIFRFANGRVDVVTPKDNHGTYAIYHNRQIIIPDLNVGLVEYSPGSSIRLMPNGDFFKDKRVRAIIPGDTLVLFTSDGRIFSYSNGSIQENNWVISDYLKSKGVTGAIALNNNTIAIGIVNGGVLFATPQGKPLFLCDTRNGLVSNAINICSVDTECGLWVSSMEGISRIEIASGVSVLGKGQGIQGAISDIAFHNNMWYVSSATGVYVAPQNRFIPSQISQANFRKVKGIASQVFAMQSVGSHLFSVGASGAHAIIDSASVFYYPFGAGNIKYLPHQKAILTGGWSGIGVIDVSKSSPKGIERLKGVEEYIDNIVAISPNEYWLKTTSGYLLNLLVGDIEGREISLKAITKVDTTQGLPSPNIYNISKTNNSLLVASDKGVHRLCSNSGKFIKQHLPPLVKEIHNIIDIDTNQFVVLSSERKIFVLNFRDDTLFIDFTLSAKVGSQKITAAKKFGSTIAIVSPEKIFAINTSTCKKIEEDKPTSLFRKIYSLHKHKYFYSGYNILPDKSTLHYSENSIRIVFTSPLASAVDEISYSHILEGFDRQWSPFSSSSEVTYTNIPEGNYTFRLKALNALGIEGDEVVWQFTVLPPWYRTTWAYLLYPLLLLLIIFGVTKQYNRHLIREKVRLEQIVKERTLDIVRQKEEIMEKNEELQQQNEEIMAQRDEIEVQKTIIEVRTNEISQSIAYAKHIQNSILPTPNEVLSSFDSSFVLYLPKDVVSGDFYWVHKHNDISLCAVADCTGHGVPGGFMSMLGTALLNEIHALNPESEPSERLELLRRKVIRSLHQDDPTAVTKDGMDISFLALNQSTLELSYASAFGKLLLIRDGEAIKLDSDRIAVGFSFTNDRFFTTRKLQLQRGDTIYAMSDGIIDQLGGVDSKKLGSKRVSELLCKLSTVEFSKHKQKIEDFTLHWMGSYTQVDDILVMGIRV